MLSFGGVRNDRTSDIIVLRGKEPRWLEHAAIRVAITKETALEVRRKKKYEALDISVIQNANKLRCNRNLCLQGRFTGNEFNGAKVRLNYIGKNGPRTPRRQPSITPF